ncbi:MAG: GrpB family protein [Gemmatimonadota bacterium]|nr:GrpB family protein [Gemmatimonadota bacterium]
MTAQPGSLGLPSGVVRVVPYDTAWPALYAAEVARLEPILLAHHVTLCLEHMGSTAVPGLAAKPVLDILAGRSTERERAAAIAALQAGGYVFRGEQGISGRDFFRRGEPRQYHLHLAEIGGAFWHDQRRFRDHLRANADAAVAYAALKRELAARYPLDREAYLDGKSAFVKGILEAARYVS